MSSINNKKPLSLFFNWETVPVKGRYSIKLGENRYFYYQKTSVFANEVIIRYKFLLLSVFQPILCLLQFFYIGSDLFSANFYQRAKEELIFSKLSKVDPPSYLIAGELGKSICQFLLRPAVSVFLVVLSVVGIFFGFDLVPFYGAIERKTLPIVPVKAGFFHLALTPPCLQIKGYPFLCDPVKVCLYRLKEKGLVAKDFYYKPSEKDSDDFGSVLKNHGTEAFINKLYSDVVEKDE